MAAVLVSSKSGLTYRGQRLGWGRYVRGLGKVAVRHGVFGSGFRYTLGREVACDAIDCSTDTDKKPDRKPKTF